jgi:glycosyltransferase involved in cell wall biosynthesis
VVTDGPQGGSSLVLLEDAQLLKTAGFEVRVWAAAGSTASEIAATVRIRTPLPLVSSAEYCIPFVRSNPGAVLLAYNEPTVAFLAPDRAVVRFDWPTPLPRYARWPGAASRFRRARYLFPSQALRDLWLKRNPVVDRRSTVVLPNAVDRRIFTSAPPPPPPPRVGYAGQWVPQKGLDVLLAAWPAVEAACPDAQLVVAGGPGLWRRTQPASGAAWLDGMVRDAAQRHRVAIMGILAREEMPALWRSIHVACVPSRCEESFGLVALEAMACGRPVVGTQRGALPEVVGDGGVLVPEDGPAALAEALTALLTDKERYEDFRRRAERRADAFALERRFERLIGLVENVAQSTRNVE